MTRHLAAFVLPAVLLPLLATGASRAATQTGPLDLSPYAGKVVLVDFWASWCHPCLESFPWMSGMQRSLGGQGLQIIAVNVDRDTTKAAAFLSRQSAKGMKIIFDPKGAIAEAYHLEGMPSTFLYDRNGKLVSSHIGFEPEHAPDYHAAIRDLLATPYEATTPGTKEKSDEK